MRREKEVQRDLDLLGESFTGHVDSLVMNAREGTSSFTGIDTSNCNFPVALCEHLVPALISPTISLLEELESRTNSETDCSDGTSGSPKPLTAVNEEKIATCVTCLFLLFSRVLESKSMRNDEKGSFGGWAQFAPVHDAYFLQQQVPLFALIIHSLMKIITVHADGHWKLPKSCITTAADCLRNVLLSLYGTQEGRAVITRCAPGIISCLTRLLRDLNRVSLSHVPRRAYESLVRSLHITLVLVIYEQGNPDLTHQTIDDFKLFDRLVNYLVSWIGIDQLLDLSHTVWGTDMPSADEHSAIDGRFAPQDLNCFEIERIDPRDLLPEPVPVSNLSPSSRKSSSCGAATVELCLATATAIICFTSRQLNASNRESVTTLLGILTTAGYVLLPLHCNQNRTKGLQQDRGQGTFRPDTLMQRVLSVLGVHFLPKAFWCTVEECTASGTLNTTLMKEIPGEDVDHGASRQSEHAPSKILVDRSASNSRILEAQSSVTSHSNSQKHQRSHLHWMKLRGIIVAIELVMERSFFVSKSEPSDEFYKCKIHASSSIASKVLLAIQQVKPERSFSLTSENFAESLLHTISEVCTAHLGNFYHQSNLNEQHPTNMEQLSCLDTIVDGYIHMAVRCMPHEQMDGDGFFLAGVIDSLLDTLEDLQSTWSLHTGTLWVLHRVLQTIEYLIREEFMCLTETCASTSTTPRCGSRTHVYSSYLTTVSEILAVLTRPQYWMLDVLDCDGPNQVMYTPSELRFKEWILLRILHILVLVNRTMGLVVRLYFSSGQHDHEQCKVAEKLTLQCIVPILGCLHDNPKLYYGNVVSALGKHIRDAAAEAYSVLDSWELSQFSSIHPKNDGFSTLTRSTIVRYMHHIIDEVLHQLRFPACYRNTRRIIQGICGVLRQHILQCCHEMRAVDRRNIAELKEQSRVLIKKVWPCLEGLLRTVTSVGFTSSSTSHLPMKDRIVMIHALLETLIDICVAIALSTDASDSTKLCVHGAQGTEQQNASENHVSPESIKSSEQNHCAPETADPSAKVLPWCKQIMQSIAQWFYTVWEQLLCFAHVDNTTVVSISLQAIQLCASFVFQKKSETEIDRDFAALAPRFAEVMNFLPLLHNTWIRVVPLLLPPGCSSINVFLKNTPCQPTYTLKNHASSRQNQSKVDPFLRNDLDRGHRNEQDPFYQFFVENHHIAILRLLGELIALEPNFLAARSKSELLPLVQYHRMMYQTSPRHRNIIIGSRIIQRHCSKKAVLEQWKRACDEVIQRICPGNEMDGTIRDTEARRSSGEATPH